MKKRLLAAFALLAFPLFANAQNETEETTATTETKADETKWSFDVGGDLVSAWVWRGKFNDGASIQPQMTVGYGPVSLNAWGSTTFDGDRKEIDLTLAFRKAGFTAEIIDYYYPGHGRFFTWEKGKTCHQLELGAGYNFGEKTRVPISLMWYTFIAGDDLDANGEYRHSSYLEIAYGFRAKEVDVQLLAGFASGESMYQSNESFNMINLTVKGTYTIEFTDKFSLPVYAKLILNPQREDLNFVLGMSF